MARPTANAVELLDIIDGLQSKIRELQEAISPGRIAKHEYYVGVARRFRESAAKHENVITSDWSPTRPRVTDVCTREIGHSGPCNGYPRISCAQHLNRIDNPKG